MKAQRSLMALTATAALFGGGCSSAEITSNQPELQRAFDSTEDYWQRRGIPMGKLVLQTVADGAVSCGEITVTNNSLSPLTYCGTIGDGRIIVSERSYDGAEKDAKKVGISPAAMGAAALGHEFGHHVMTATATSFGEEKKDELAADCLGAVVVAATDPSLRDEARAFLASHEDETHGTAAERAAAFDNGFSKGVIGCDKTLPTLLGLPPASSGAVTG